ncbi:two-component regulator propeller domain-containing protein [Flavobacterium sp. ACN6]|uniref:two-component regulator propeller domain-containing protein n=1 Tax=Flavobacterium sp. ACN6 TaxID=1920426 RepID=UPI000BB379F0|nr:two-component regulator propeller domain-containing protein [Flavobacterium sp. ACN6]PBJ09361.1 HTH-type transcriptional regulator CdhR [Flavobacterium sp. ACN6]
MARSLLLLFSFFTIFSFGQQIKFESFTANHGLSNNSVADIESDKDGGLWIATWDGLNYFDGYNFKIYKNNLNDLKTISSNYITKLRKDAEGQIWLITKEGNINSYLGNDEFKEFKFKSLPKDIHLSQKGNIVVETSTAFYEFKNKSFVEIPQNKVKRKDFNTLKNILLKKYPKLIINDILKDKLGNIWFATRENGLYILSNDSDENNIEHITADIYASYSFKSNEIETLHEDDFGNIWLGQKDGGLSMAYTGSQEINSTMPHPVKEPFLPAETIRAVTKDTKGKIWLGYYTRGLYHYNENRRLFEKFKIEKAGLDPDWERIRTLFTSSEGSVWAGTYKGILRISGNNVTSYENSNADGMNIMRCYSIYEDQNKQLWMGCWGGLAKFNLTAGRFEKFKGQELVKKYHIRCVKKNNQNLILATENNGVIVFNSTTGTIKKITTKEGILGNSIYSLFVDNESDNYWIASLGGVTVFNKKTGLVKNITELEGLPSHMVYGIIDNGNKVWISTTKGIASIDKKTYAVTSYNPNNGWQAPEFSEGAYFQDSKGNLFFGGVAGLNYFNPNTIYSNGAKAKIKLKVDGSTAYAAAIEKSFSHNELEIELIPILFPKKKTDVYYKLEGKDEKWILAVPGSKIKYTHLSSGDYRFLIKQGRDGIPEPVFFTLNVGKAFYESISFYMLLSGCILLFCIIVVYVKNKAAQTQQKYLEELVTARTAVIENQKKNLEDINVELDQKNKKIEEQKEKLLILHSDLKNENFEIEKFKTFMLAEFQKPISEIIKVSSSFKKDTEIHRELLLKTSKLVNLISEWNYLEHVKDLGPVKKTAANLFPVLKNNVEKLKKNLQLNQVNLNCEIDNTNCFAMIDILRLKLSMQYFFNDICKYSDKDSTLNIAISCENNLIQIKVDSDSIILKNNWYNISHYSPYFTALQILLQDLKAELIPSSERHFQAVLNIPIEFVDPDVNFKETISWKNFNYENQFSEGKKCLLVFGDPYNNPAANQVLESENYNIIYESSISNLNAVIKQIDIAALVFYQASFSKELLNFLQLNKENSNIKIPLIYISEDINYELDEQLLEIGIDTHIKLPASVSFVRKKIDSLIHQNVEPLREHKIQQKIFEILTEDNEHVTANEKLLKRALEIIKEQLQNPLFNVEMLGEELGISRVKCYRVFKETLNQSPSDILMSLRLQKAEVLLKTKRLNISEISFECGYNDPKYFGRSFKKYFGKTPKEYKESKELKEQTV